MTDHYETLGVPRDATPQQIKSAWRKLSSEHHPDRQGGDAERMAAVNRAFEVLGQPDKRKLYDETGDDGTQSQLDRAADAALEFFFDEAIQKQAEPVEYARRQLHEKDRLMEKNLAEIAIVRTKLTSQKGKTKTKRRTNLVETLLARKLAELDRHELQTKTALQVQAKAREFLADYIATETDEQRAERVRAEAMAAQHAAMQNAFGRPNAFIPYQFPAA